MVPDRCFIHDLVDDVLRLIFVYSLPDASICDPEYPNMLDTSCAPVSLTHVCSRWRAVAQSTSELWTAIRINFVKTESQWLLMVDIDWMKECLQAWIARSGSFPLTIDYFRSQGKTTWLSFSVPLKLEILDESRELIPWDRVEHLGLQGLGLGHLQYNQILERCLKLGERRGELDGLARVVGAEVWRGCSLRRRKELLQLSLLR